MSMCKAIYNLAGRMCKQHARNACAKNKVHWLLGIGFPGQWLNTAVAMT